MNVRAKMTCHEKTNQKDSKTAEPRCVVALRPVYGDTPENKTWSKYTPSGEVKLYITNPAAADAFEVGEEYFVDFSKAE